MNFYHSFIHDLVLSKFCNIPSLFSQHHLTHIVWEPVSVSRVVVAVSPPTGYVRPTGGWSEAGDRPRAVWRTATTPRPASHEVWHHQCGGAGTPPQLRKQTDH